MVFLFYLIVIALTTIQSVMSQEGNFGQFGENTEDARFTVNFAKDPQAIRDNSRYVEWYLRENIPAFGKSGNRKILVSKCNSKSYNYRFCFKPIQ